MLTRDAAVQLLRQFTCLERLPAADVPACDRVCQAVREVAHHSDYQIFGICAETAEQATLALHTYLSALGYDDRPGVDSLPGPLYVKYNPNTRRCHTAPYGGEHRGVLISCQSAYDHDVNETFGHLPLDLFQTP